ncbi:enoyl-CoA hydratase-related protein [Corynebacterium breve]|uniref:Enoyl-CoA hydratase-related protein n=1 Tax=Corynebacterium breve TaxID=3049799 RepID=A0ABY8VE48_9CORY|nr:enoyl-CoA hydratase-related protein [Corynebacterium breve]WIM67382.1 enoyl-CoA hydratase-related protein [Corynebacterium breve]
MPSNLVTSQSFHEGLACLLTLNRNSKRNALNVDLSEELIDEFLRLQSTPVRAIVLTGDGPIFSAGADLKERDFAGELYPALERLMGTIRTLSVPVIAAVNGPAIGAGAMLAMACDFRVVGETASFRTPVTDMAIGVDQSTVRNLELLVGGARARAMLMLGQELDAAGALACGFALQTGGVEEALALAGLLTQKAPLTVKQLKMDFAHVAGEPFTEAECDKARLAAWNSEDFQEVRRAREEKRPPKFLGE